MLLSGFSDSLDRTIVSKKIEIFAHCLRPTALSDTDALYIKGMDYAVGLKLLEKTLSTVLCITRNQLKPTPRIAGPPSTSLLNRYRKIEIPY